MNQQNPQEYQSKMNEGKLKARKEQQNTDISPELRYFLESL